MAKAEVESPLLRENRRARGVDASILLVAEDIAESRDELQAALWKGRSVVVALCSIGAIVLLCAALSHDNVRLQKGGELDSDADPPYDFYTVQRTTFHFQPKDNFMSDPCAPMYFNGYYHLFYQWNPYGRTWGNMTWGHTVSKDLIHWKYLGVSLEPSEWYDMQGTWSGYVTIVEGSPIVLYTGGRGLFGGDANQSISMALPVDPSDPFLRKWKKVDNNPLILTPEGFSSQAFRDPTTGWREDDQYWRTTIGSVIENADRSRDGVALMYTSIDFYHWDLQETLLHRVQGTGTWECVDLFPILVESEVGINQTAVAPEHYHDNMKYVLKAGMDETRIDYYAIGTYSTKTHTFTPDDPSQDVGIGLRYDYGRFYASKTFYDVTTRRRVLWGYIHESDSEDDDIIKGWACLQGIPRTVWLDGSTLSNVLQWPVVELESLRGAHASYHNIDLQPTDVLKVQGGDGPQLDILVVFEKPDVSGADDETPADFDDFDCRAGADHRSTFGPFGFLVLADGSRIEHSDIFFYISRSKDGQWGTIVCSDQSRSSLYDNLDKTVYGHALTVLPSEEELSLRILVDHSIVETFVQGGRFTITSRIYPTLAIGPKSHLFLFNNATTPIKVKSLDVYQMSTVHMTSI